MVRSTTSLFTALLLLSGCGGGGSPTSPGGLGADTFASAAVDAQPFTASILVALTGNTDGRGWLSLVALNGCGANDTQIALSASKLDLSPISAGDYSASRSIQVPLGPGVSTTVRELTAAIIQGNQTWQAPAQFGSGGSGVLTITSVTSTYVEGSFSFVAVPGFGNPSTASKSASGSFRARIEDKRIC